MMAWRYTLAAPVLLLIAGPRNVFAVAPRQAVALLVLGGGGQSAVTWLSLSALQWLPAAAASFLFYTYPAWVAIFAALAGIERLSGARVAALAIAFAGITAMVGAPWNFAFPLPGVVRELAAAMVYAAYIPLVHRLRGSLDAATASAWIITGCAVGFQVMALPEGGALAPMHGEAWGIALFLALVCTVVAFSFFLKGLSVLGPVRTAIIATTEPLWTAVLSLFVLGQALGLGTLVGGLCIVAAILLLQRPPAPIPRPADSSP